MATEMISSTQHSATAAWRCRQINKQAGWRPRSPRLGTLDLRTLPKFHCHGNEGRPHNILRGSVESATPTYYGMFGIWHSSMIVAKLWRHNGIKYWGLLYMR